MRAGEDKDRLIRIRQQDLPVFALRPRIQPDDGSLPLLNLFDDPSPIRQNRDPDSIPDSRDIARGSTSFQLAPQLTDDKALPSVAPA